MASITTAQINTLNTSYLAGAEGRHLAMVSAGSLVIETSDTRELFKLLVRFVNEVSTDMEVADLPSAKFGGKVISVETLPSLLGETAELVSYDISVVR